MDASVENLADISETSNSANKYKSSINSIFYLVIQVSLSEKQFLPLKLNKQMEN